MRAITSARASKQHRQRRPRKDEHARAHTHTHTRHHARGICALAGMGVRAEGGIRMGGRERIYAARIAERQGCDLGNNRREREAARRAGWVRTRQRGVWCLRSAVTMGLTLFVKRGGNEHWEGKKGKQKNKKNPRVHYGCPQRQRFSRQCQRSYGRRRYGCDRCDTGQRAGEVA